MIKNSCHLPIPTSLQIGIRQSNSNCNIIFLQSFYALGCSDSCKNHLVSWEKLLVSLSQGSFLAILSSRRSSAVALFVIRHALAFLHKLRDNICKCYFEASGERKHYDIFIAYFTKKKSMEDILVLFSCCLMILSQSQTLTYKLLKT